MIHARESQGNPAEAQDQFPVFEANSLTALAALSVAALSTLAVFYFLPSSPLNGDDATLIQHAYSSMWSSARTFERSNVAGEFKAALRRDPASPFRWCDMGTALADEGKLDEAARCFARAVELGPAVPAILLRAANFHMKAGHRAEAIRLMANVLGQTAEYDAIIFSYYRRLGLSFEDVLRSGIPNDRRSTQAYFLSLLSLIDEKALRDAWNWAAHRGFADDTLARAYVAHLLPAAPETAKDFWSEYAGERRGDFGRPNAVFNGGFEAESTAALLDWNPGSPAGSVSARDQIVAHGGVWSMRLEVRKIGIALSQVVVLEPGNYMLTAWYRVERLSSDAAVVLRVREWANPQNIHTTAELSRTPPASWKSLQREFAVGSPSNPFVISVEALELSGESPVFWLDDIKLERHAKSARIR